MCKQIYSAFINAWHLPSSKVAKWESWVLTWMMEFHGTRQKFHRIPWNFSRSQGKLHGIPWNFKSSMELDINIKFHGMPWNWVESAHLEKKSHGIPWLFLSSMELGSITKFHGIPWNPQTLVTYSMEFHWTMKVSPSLELNKIPCNSMKYSVEFHGTLVPPNTLSPCSMEFHGTLEIYHFHRNQVPFDFHGIFLEISWNSIAKSDVIKFHGIPWNLVIANLNDIRSLWTSMEFSIEFHGIPESPYHILKYGIDR